MLSGKINTNFIESAQDKIDRLQQKINLLKLQNIKIHHYNNSKKQEFNSIIPLKIYQTWHTKNLPPLMNLAVEKLKKRHPRFEHFLFDDNDCRNFIQSNFGGEVLHAFDSLIPGAYKADLWRYCILYINGGIYVDIKYCCVNHFRFIELTESEHWVLDRDGNSIYNALLVCLPKNEILLKCINQIVENVKNKYYGSCCLDPTGPGLVSKFLSNEDKTKMKLIHLWNQSDNSKFILYNNIAVLKMYNNYYGEHGQYQKVDHYSALWGQRKIYKR